MDIKLLDSAYQYCKENGHRFTEPRKWVLYILMTSNKPLTAYEVLEELSSCLDGPKPPTVYRAIHFWEAEGFIHSIDSLKAYIACSHGHHHGDFQFVHCIKCDAIQEIHRCEAQANIHPLNIPSSFKVNSTITEIKGVCEFCG